MITRPIKNRRRQLARESRVLQARRKAVKNELLKIEKRLVRIAEDFLRAKPFGQN